MGDAGRSSSSPDGDMRKKISNGEVYDLPAYLSTCFGYQAGKATKTPLFAIVYGYLYNCMPSTYTTISTNSSHETILVGAQLGRILPPGSVIAFRGTYGSGKSTLIRGIARGLGVRASRHPSPSFILVQSFRTRRRGTRYLHHADLWRIPHLSTEDSGALREMLEQHDAISAIEWAHRLPRALKAYVTLTISCAVLGPKRRRFTITPGLTSARATQRVPGRQPGRK